MKKNSYPVPVVIKEIMKYTTLIAITLRLLTSVCLADPTYAQDLLNKPVTIEFKNIALREALNQISIQASCQFIYSKNLLPLTDKVSLKTQNSKLSSVLDELLKPYGVIYEPSDSYIFIKAKPKSTTLLPEKSIGTITGKVIDSQNGEPMVGVNIALKNTTKGTITDAKGEYSIGVTDENAVLIFTFIGYNNEEVRVGSQTIINVSLVPSIETLSQVVVIAYGIQEKRDLTGSVTKVLGKDFSNQPQENINARLQGRVAGLQVVQHSGNLGVESLVRVRGTGPLLGPADPLYVIDGVPVLGADSGAGIGSRGGQQLNTISNINYNDIESVEVLKDAAAVSLYGARASNGVILITTKRGSKSGNSKLDFSYYTGFSQPTNHLNLLNGQQLIDFYETSLVNTNARRAALGQSLIQADQNFINTRNRGNNTDWQKEIFRQNAPVSSYNFSLSGGSEKTQYYTSVAYFDQSGVAISNRLRRFNGRVNIDHQALPKLKISTSIGIGYQQLNRVGEGGDRNSIVSLAYGKNPNLAVYNPDGTFATDDPTNKWNPIQEASEVTYKNLMKKFLGTAYGEYEFIKGLKLRSQWSTEITRIDDNYFEPTTLQGVGNTFAQNASYQQTNWASENYLTYITTLGTQHKINALLGFSQQFIKYEQLEVSNSKGSNNIVTTVNNGSSPNINDRVEEQGVQSVYSRVNYTFKDKYLFTGNLRADASSRFGANKRWGLFPSAAIAWRFSSEPFLNNVDWLSDSKFRVSYGLAGNQNSITSIYAYQGPVALGINYIQGYAGAASGQGDVPNNNLQWEVNKQLDLGLDLTFFKGRISLTADYYNRVTDKAIFPVRVPLSQGFFTVRANVAGLENKGVEFSLTTQNLTGAFKWSTSFNIAHNRAIITKIPGVGQQASGSTNLELAEYTFFPSFEKSPQGIYRVGYAPSSFYGFESAGVDPTTGNALYLNKEGNAVTGNKITATDSKIIGNPYPKHTGGIENTFSYQGIDLSIFLNWSYGNQLYNSTRAALVGNDPIGFVPTTEVLRSWSPSNTNTDVPIALLGSDANINNLPSTRFVEDGSFLRLRSLSLGYNFQNGLIQRLKMRSARVYISAQNLLTFTKYSGVDPETLNRVYNARTLVGFDILPYPQVKTYQIGINLGF